MIMAEGLKSDKKIRNPNDAHPAGNRVNLVYKLHQMIVLFFAIFFSELITFLRRFSLSWDVLGLVVRLEYSC